MKCPKCGSRNISTKDSRPGHNQRLSHEYTRRVRECNMCGSRFTTMEVIIRDTPPCGDKAGMDRAIYDFCDSVSGYNGEPNLRKAIKLWNSVQIIMKEGNIDAK